MARCGLDLWAPSVSCVSFKSGLVGTVGEKRMEMHSCSWRNDQVGRKEGVELLEAPGVRERIQGWEAKTVEQSPKRGEGG